MSKLLDSVIKEMNNYGNMGLPSGETSMGMGDTATLGMRGLNNKNKIKAYKLSDLLRKHTRAEEEETPDEMDFGMDTGMDTGMDAGMDAGMEYNDDDDNNPLKQFFMNNPSPSDDDILRYAEENQLDLSEMRLAIYSLIQDLLKGSSDDEMGEMGDFDDIDNSDELEFSVSGDTGERPATNELGNRPRF